MILGCSPTDEHQGGQNFPTISVSVSGHGKMIAEHDKYDWHRHERVVLGAKLGLGPKRRIEGAPGAAAAIILR